MVYTAKKFFFLWIALELSLFRSIPLLNLKNSINNKLYSKAINKSILTQIYFVFQRIGRVIILWGLIYKNKRVLLILGLLIKIGLLPFFWWFIFIIQFLNWIKIYIFSILNKFILIRVLSFFYVKFNILVNLLILRAALRIIGLIFKIKNIKLIFGWRSILDSSFLILLSSISFKYFLGYFLGYSVIMGLIVFRFFLIDNTNFYYSKFIVNFLKSIKGVNLLVLLGTPPFIRFIYKLSFLRVMRYYKEFFNKKFIILFLFGFMFFFQSLIYFLIFLKYSKRVFKKKNYWGLKKLKIIVFFRLFLTPIWFCFN